MVIPGSSNALLVAVSNPRRPLAPSVDGERTWTHDFRNHLNAVKGYAELCLEEDQAELFGLSRRTLARRLQVQGTTVSAELAALRRARAEEALRDPGLTVAEVGAAVGYPDAVVFSRAFRRWTRTTPQAYRESGSA